MSARTLLVTIGVAAVGACGLSTSGLGPADSAGTGSGSAGTGGAVTVGSSTSGSSGASTTTSGGGQGGATTSAQSSAGSGGAGGAASSSTSGTSGSGGSSSSSTSASSSSGSIPTCAEQYGTVPGYQLCETPVGVCEFNVSLNQQTSCGEVCGKRGGECQLTIDNGAACEYLGPTQPCNFTNYGSAVCRCTQGCGGGPACASPQTCTGSHCI